MSTQGYLPSLFHSFDHKSQRYTDRLHAFASDLASQGHPIRNRPHETPGDVAAGLQEPTTVAMFMTHGLAKDWPAEFSDEHPGGAAYFELAHLGDELIPAKMIVALACSQHAAYWAPRAAPGTVIVTYSRKLGCRNIWPVVRAFSRLREATPAAAEAALDQANAEREAVRKGDFRRHLWSVTTVGAA